MVDVVKITPQFSIGPQIEADDFERLRAAGFKSILNARPDDETGPYILSDEAKTLADAHGLAYAFTPTEGYEIFEPDVVDRFEEALAALPRPIFAHCKTGTRAAILWALVAARHGNVEKVIETLRAAGQELDFLEDELRAAAASERKSPFQLKDDPLLTMGELTQPEEEGAAPE